MVYKTIKPSDLVEGLQSPQMSEHLVRVSRLKELQSSRGWDDAELARQCARKQQQVYAWFSNNRTIGEKLARSLEEALKLPRYWLDERPGLLPKLEVREELQIYGASVKANEPAPEAAQRVPVLQWVQLSTMLLVPNATLASGVETLSTFAPATAQAKFVVVPDDSMADVYQEGDHVLLDPALAPRAGDTVLVKIASGEHFLRVFKPRTALAWTAEPLNSKYEALSSAIDGAEIVAVMIEHRRYRQR